MDLLRLNIPVIDDELRGLPSGSVIAIEGRPLSYADLIARHILANRAYLGEKVIYFAIDDDVDDVRDSMLALNFRIQAFEASGLWSFIDKSKGQLQDLFNLLLDNVMRGGFSSCIDTFSSLVTSACKSEEEMLEMMQKLKSASKIGGGFHILLVVPTMHKTKQLDVIRSRADVVMKVSYEESGNSYIRYLKIVKIKRRPHQGIVVPFTITRSGIAFESVTRIA